MILVSNVNGRVTRILLTISPKSTKTTATTTATATTTTTTPPCSCFTCVSVNHLVVSESVELNGTWIQFHMPGHKCGRVIEKQLTSPDWKVCNSQFPTVRKPMKYFKSTKTKSYILHIEAASAWISYFIFHTTLNANCGTAMSSCSWLHLLLFWLPLVSFFHSLSLWRKLRHWVRWLFTFQLRLKLTVLIAFWGPTRACLIMADSFSLFCCTQTHILLVLTTL